MNVSLQIPRILARYVDGQMELEVPEGTLAELLNHLEQHHPSLFANLCDETGALRKHIHLFINDQLVTAPRSHPTAVSNGDVVAVFQAVSGG